MYNNLMDYMMGDYNYYDNSAYNAPPTRYGAMDLNMGQQQQPQEMSLWDLLGAQGGGGMMGGGSGVMNGARFADDAKRQYRDMSNSTSIGQLLAMNNGMKRGQQPNRNMHQNRFNYMKGLGG